MIRRLPENVSDALNRSPVIKLSNIILGCVIFVLVAIFICYFIPAATFWAICVLIIVNLINLIRTLIGRYHKRATFYHEAFGIAAFITCLLLSTIIPTFALDITWYLAPFFPTMVQLYQTLWILCLIDFALAFLVDFLKMAKKP